MHEPKIDIVCACVCVCVCEREREREREKQAMCESIHHNSSKNTY